MVSGVFSIPLAAHGGARRQSFSADGQTSWPLHAFIAGRENRLAHVAAESMFEDRARYNPLVFYGEPGTGKSHLTRGLAARLAQLRPGVTIVTVTGADFARAYVDAVDTNSLSDLRQRYHHADLLLLEDLHQLAGKPKPQQELSHMIDTRGGEDRQVVVTMRRLPAETSDITDALASRLQGGLTVPLAKPAEEARLALLESLAQWHALEIAPAALQLLAAELPVTASQLNHALLQLAAQAESRIEATSAQSAPPIDEAAVREYLQQHNDHRQITLAAIAKCTARHFKLTVADLKSATRRQTVVQARGIAMWFARRLTDQSLSKIGRFFGRRDHTTVMHACRQVESRIQDDAAARHAVSALSDLLGVSVQQTSSK